MEQFPDRDPTLDALEQLLRTFGTGATPAELLRQSMGEIEIVMPPPTPSLILPPNIDSLLATSLEDAGMPGNQTSKYVIKGHPEFVVRYDQGVTRAGCVIAHRAARAVGLNVIPAEYRTYDEGVYTIVPRVNGLPLEEALATDPSPELLEAADQNWTNIAHSLVVAGRFGLDWPSDAYTPNQCMWGTLPGETQPRLWVVDLPTRTYKINEANEYGMELLYDISGLLEAEDAAGQELPRARHAFGEIVAALPDSEDYGDGFRRAGAHCLINRQNMARLRMEDTEFVESFRTDDPE